MSIEDEVKYKEDSTANLKLKEDEERKSPSPPGPAKIRTQYTYEKLISYRFLPIVTKPDCLADEFCNEEGTWDPELWHAALSGGKKSPRPPSRSTSPAFGLKPARRPSDAKERLKAEQDGIILSPQRRSFGHGCQISFPQPPSSLASEPRPIRPKSPLDRNYRERSNSDVADTRPGPGRRRVITRPSREALLGKDRPRAQESTGYPAQEHLYQRQTSYDQQQHNKRRGRGNEPEWLTDVANSNLEQIELLGFGEAEEEERAKVKGVIRRDAPSRQQPTELDHLVAALQSGAEQQQQATTPSKEFDLNDFFNFSDPISTSPAEEQSLAQSRFSHLFNAPVSVDGRSSRGSSRRSSLHREELDFLQELRGHSGSESDAGSTPIHALINDTPESTPFTLLEMLQRGGQENLDVENDMRKREVQQKLMEGQAKSLAEIESGLKKDPVKKRRRSSGSLPPVARGGSPADSGDQSAFTNFLATLGKSNESGRTAGREQSPSHATPSMGPQRSPVTLLFQNGPSSEARVPSGPSSVELPPLHTDQFVRSELEELHNRGVSPLNRSSILDMLSSTPQHSTASSEASFVQRQSPMTSDQLASILQQQIAANQRQRAAGQEVLANVVKQAVVTNPSLVASILSSQQEGRIAAQHRAVSPQERYHQALLQQQQAVAAAQRAHSPLVTSPLGFIGTHSPLTPSPLPGGIVSPLGPTSHLIPPPPMGVAVPPPGAHQPSPIRPRIPSPQELVKHTQNILQQALIKRQLEVQREKFYARQERDTRSRSPVPGTPGHAGQRRRTPPATPTSRPSSTVSTAFTPTSVIRRMHDHKAEVKEAEEVARRTPELGQMAAQPTAENSGPSEPDQHIPIEAVGSPLRKPDLADPVTGVHSSPMRGEDCTVPGQPVGEYSSPQRREPPPSQSDFGSPSLKDRGRGDAAEVSNNRITGPQDDKKHFLPDPKTITAANGDTVSPKMAPPGIGMQPGAGPILTPMASGLGPQVAVNQGPGVDDQPLGARQQMPLPTQPPGLLPGMGSKQPVTPLPPPAGMVAQSGAQMGGPDLAQQQPGAASQQEQPRSAMRMTSHPPSQRPPHMMQGRPPQFPTVMHPARGMPPLGSPMHPMAQQMRGMMYTVPPPRAPTLPAAVNPMAFLAMQQLNQRAVMTQMQMPAAQSPMPTAQGLQRGMLAQHYPSPSQPTMHHHHHHQHHPGSMGMPMVSPRNHLPQHPQMAQPPRMHPQQHGMMTNDGSGQRDQHSAMFSMPSPTGAANALPPSPGIPQDNPLAKWFGNDVLRHSMGSVGPPRVPEGLKVLSVEELERQQQVVS